MSSTQMTLEVTDKAPFKYTLKAATQKRRALCDAIDNIKEHKRKNKALYRAYYMAQKEIDEYIREHESNEDVCEFLKSFLDIDASEIFYKVPKHD